MPKKQSFKNGNTTAPIAFDVINAKVIRNGNFHGPPPPPPPPLRRSSSSTPPKSSAVPSCFTLTSRKSSGGGGGEGGGGDDDKIAPSSSTRLRRNTTPESASQAAAPFSTSARKRKINYTQRKSSSDSNGKKRKAATSSVSGDDTTQRPSFNLNPTLMLPDAAVDEIREKKKRAASAAKKSIDEFYGKKSVSAFQPETTHDLQELLGYLQRLHEHFLAQAERLTAIVEPSLDESLNYFKNMKNAFASFYQQMECVIDLEAQSQLFNEAINFVNKRCKEIKVLKRTNDAKADEVERLLHYVEKLQYAVSATHDIRRLPSSVRKLVRPTFDYVPGSDRKVACVVEKAPLPRTISTVQLQPPRPPPPQPPSEDMDALLEKELNDAMKELRDDEGGGAGDKDDSTESVRDPAPASKESPITIVTQLGTEERDQSMAPSQRAKVLTQSMVHRFTSPLDSAEAHAGKRAATFSDSEKMRQIYALAAKNRATSSALKISVPLAQQL